MLIKNYQNGVKWSEMDDDKQYNNNQNQTMKSPTAGRSKLRISAHFLSSQIQAEVSNRLQSWPQKQFAFAELEGGFQ